MSFGEGTLLYAEEIEQIQEECDGFSHSVCRSMVRERMREEEARVVTIEDPPSQEKRREPDLPMRRRVLGAYGTSCVYCGLLDVVGIDYIVPPSREGKLRLDNIVPACERCMADRGDMNLWDWFERRPDLDDRAILGRIAQGRLALRDRAAPLRRAA
jgi:5-methylcytosine-specific restriction endonuclease McrA